MALATLICVGCISSGQLLFRKAALSLSGKNNILDWLTNEWLFLALALYGFTTLGWIWILREVPLYLAYPFMGLAFLLVPLLSWIFLGEPLRWQTLAGGALIMAGVALASFS